MKYSLTRSRPNITIKRVNKKKEMLLNKMK